MAQDPHAPPVTNAKRIADLYRRYAEELTRYLSRRLPCPDQATDLVQELFARLLSPKQPGPPIRHERGFLFASAKHLATEIRQSPKWQTGVESDESAEAMTDNSPLSPEQALEQRRTADALLQTIGELPPRCREVFILHKFDGLSYAHIARHLDISHSSVEKHMARALAACRQQLQDERR